MEKEQKNKFETLFEEVREYLQLRQQLIKLKAIEKTTSIASHMISWLIIVPIFVLAFLFVSITLAYVFAAWWGHIYAGYLTVTLLYIIIGLLLVKFRQRWLVKPMMNAMLKQILSKESHD